MAISTVKLNGETLLTVNDTTAVTSDVASGKTFTLVDGTKGTGTATSSGISIVETQDPGGGTVLTITGEEIYHKISPKQINFIDYDGTIVYSYTAQELQALTALPINPTHTGLISQGWNWTLAEIKSQLLASPESIIWVGQLYITQSGDTEIDIQITETTKLDPCLSVSVDGSITIDWGDGSTPDTVTGSSVYSRKKILHNYAFIGDYTIRISSISGNYSFYGNSSNPIIRKNIEASSYREHRGYATCVQAIRLGNNVNPLGKASFNHCYNLKYVTIPSGTVLNTVGDEAGLSIFEDCNSVAIILPPSITINLDFMFQSSSCQYISLPSTITAINESAFYEASHISSITIPEGVVSIGNRAFSTCYSLGAITIPSTVTSIGESAFYNSQSISEYHIKPIVPPTLGADAFYGLPADTIIYVPIASLSAYQAAENWSNYASYMVGE